MDFSTPVPASESMTACIIQGPGVIATCADCILQCQLPYT